MFGFGKKSGKSHISAVDSESFAAGVSSADAARLEAYLDALIAGRYKFHDFPDHPGLAAKMREALEAQARADEDSLARSVEVSVAVNETVVLGAEMNSIASQVNQRAQSMSAAVEELNVSIQNISANAASVSDETKHMRQGTAEGLHAARESTESMNVIAESVRKTTEKVGDLVAASREIRKVLDLISEIAGQTNLLALNATIEAARAGEAGKGFAVVAGEVKQLATQTAGATEEISGKIAALVEGTGVIETLMKQVGEAVSAGRGRIDHTARKVEEMSGLSEDIARRIDQVSGILAEQQQAVAEVAQGVDQVAILADGNVGQIKKLLDSIDVAGKVLVDLLARFPGKDIDNLTVTLAKSDHVIWKKRLASMLVDRETLNPNELADHKSCRLGKWYYSDASLPYRDLQAFKDLEDPHIRVHKHGIECARLYTEQRDVNGALAQAREVESASRGVLQHLETLRKAEI